MAYFLISFNQKSFEPFVGRFSFLQDGIWIDDKEHLLEVLNIKIDASCFIIHFTGSNPELDQWIMSIRQLEPVAKVVLVVEKASAQELKTHQLSAAGADAYVNFQTEEEPFLEVIEGLQTSEMNHENRLVDSGPTTEAFSDQSDLSQFKDHATSTELDKIFSSVVTVSAVKPKWQSVDTFKDPQEDLGSGEDMSDKDQDLSFDDLEELEVGENSLTSTEVTEQGMELDLSETPDFSVEEESEAIQFVESDDDFVIPDHTHTNLQLNQQTSATEMIQDDLEDDFSLSDEGDEVEADDELALDDGDDNNDDGLSLDDDEEERPKRKPKAKRKILLAEDEGPLENIGDLDFSDLAESSADASMDLDSSLDLSAEEDGDGLSLDFDADTDMDLNLDATNVSGGELSDDAREKLKEIDAIMDLDASQTHIKMDSLDDDDDLGLDEDLLSMDLEMGDLDSETADDFSLNIESGLADGETIGADLSPADDFNIDSLEFDTDQDEKTRIAPLKLPPRPQIKAPVPAPTPVTAKATPAAKEVVREKEQEREYQPVYSGDMERAHATIANLRADREELLNRIQKLEDEKLLQNRQALTTRAELDEKKIELSIIRKKLNNEVNELKDRMKIIEEKRMILEEKNRFLSQELDKAGQKNKIDIKKVQMRERELEQKLELLKSDAETQIRHRDLKILELKRKIDAMEFDMESISLQEKKSVESRYDLEDKLEKAIKTLRSAITVLEEDGEKSNALDALKKNIDM